MSQPAEPTTAPDALVPRSATPDPGAPRPSAPDADPAGGVRTIRLPRLRRVVARHSTLAIALAYLLLAALLVIPTVFGARDLSQLDEVTHADYALRLSRGEIPANGDTITPALLDYWAAVGQDGVVFPPAGAPADAWPNGGYNYNAFHPPLYYLLTGLAGRALAFVVPDLGFVTAARLTGIAWLAGGMFVLYLALRRWKVGRAVAAVAPLALLAIPLTTHAATTINPDGATMLAGAAALWFAADLLAGRRVNLLALAGVTAAISATRIMNALPLLALAGMALVLAVCGSLRRDAAVRRRTALAGLVVLATFLAVYLGWSWIQSSRGDPAWVNPTITQNTFPIDRSPVVLFGARLFSGIDLLADYWLQPELRNEAWSSWTLLAEYLAIAAGFVALVAFKPRDARRRLGWMVLLGGSAVAVAVNVQWYLVSHGEYYFMWVNRRYGMSLIPVAIACLALAAQRGRLTKPLTGVLGIGLVISYLTAFATLG